VEMEEAENEIVFSSGKSKMGLKLREMRLPLEEVGDIPKKGWKKVPVNFAEAINFVSPCSTKDAIRPILGCISLTAESAVASDSYKIGVFYWESNFEAVLIPAENLKQVIKMNPTHFNLGEGWIHFKTEDKTIISSRILNEPYPNVTKILDLDEPNKIKLPGELKEAVERSEIFLKGQPLKIQLTEKKILIHSENESGWVQENYPVKYKGQPFTFLIDPSTLKYVLDTENETNLSLNKIKFEGENWCFLSLLAIQNDDLPF